MTKKLTDKRWYKLQVTESREKDFLARAKSDKEQENVQKWFAFLKKRKREVLANKEG